VKRPLLGAERIKYDVVKSPQTLIMTLERIGPYRIVRLLGKGGMGAVYEGVHEAIERRVAIKVLHAELARRQDIAMRFVNEARAVNRIEHPGLVQVTDHGQLPDGMAYIVMEFLKGETLGQRVKRQGGRLSIPEVIRLGRQVASALAAAHEKDIVHRDLKPDNIMIVPNSDVAGGEQIKVLDFGIAKLTELQSGDSEAHTRADALLGTPRYMSPEQCRGGGHTDSKSDVYSLGVILYELLAGAAPFLGNSHGELIVAHMMHQPPPLAERVDAGTPDQLVQLVMRMLLKDKETRPTMRQVVVELDRLGGFMSGVFGAVPLGPGMPGVSGQLGLVMQQSGPGSLPGTGSLAGAPGYPSQPGVAGASLPSQPGQIALSMGSLPGTTGPGSLPGQGPSSPAGSTLGLASGQVPPRPRWPIAVALGSVLGAVGVGVVLLMTLSKPPPMPPPPPPPQKIEQPAAPAPAKKNVRWVLNSQPAGAMVIRQRDGQILGVTPLTLNNPMAEGTESVRLVLQGYAEESLSLDMGKDAEQRVELRQKKTREKGRKKGHVPSDLTVLD
jgi:tRNA A-37 threonylcarbamoyl transferase component Bud32